MNCETAYSIAETAAIIAASLLINLTIAVIGVQYILRLINANFQDVSLLPPLPHSMERNAPEGFTPVDPTSWAHLVSGEGVAYWSDGEEAGEIPDD